MTELIDEVVYPDLTALVCKENTQLFPDFHQIGLLAQY